jgi:hypothetical protein
VCRNLNRQPTTGKHVDDDAAKDELKIQIVSKEVERVTLSEMEDE